jgi:hypothetical protein
MISLECISLLDQEKFVVVFIDLPSTAFSSIIGLGQFYLLYSPSTSKVLMFLISNIIKCFLRNKEISFRRSEKNSSKSYFKLKMFRIKEQLPSFHHSNSFHISIYLEPNLTLENKLRVR